MNILNKAPAFWHRFDFIALMDTPHVSVRWEYDTNLFAWKVTGEKGAAEVSGYFYDAYHEVHCIGQRRLKKPCPALNTAICNFFAQERLLRHLLRGDDGWCNWASPKNLAKTMMYKRPDLGCKVPSQQECLAYVRDCLLRLIDVLDRKSGQELENLYWTGFDGRWLEIEMAARMAYVPVSIACHRAGVGHD